MATQDKALQTQDNNGKQDAVLDTQIPLLLDRWSRGETNLKEIYGFNAQELHGISNQGYLLLMQGKTEQAKIIFEGLIAIDPRNDYFYRALGVIYHHLGETDKAVRQFGYAIKVNRQDLTSYVNRAEIYIQQKKYALAEQDLKEVLVLSAHDHAHPAYKKADSLIKILNKR